MKVLVLGATVLLLACGAGGSGPSQPMPVSGNEVANPGGAGAPAAAAGTTGTSGSSGAAASSVGGSSPGGSSPGGSSAAGSSAAEAGTSGSSAGQGGTVPAPGVDASDPRTPFGALPANCRGFEVLGLTHSPGGDTLPNTCAPFHNVYNNPFAIRCIDADPSYDTGWLGDEWCILPPQPELGTQVAITPSSYDDPGEGFVLEPGLEIVNNHYKNADNTEQRHFYRVNLRMRTGSHHILTALIADRSDGWTLESDTGLSQRQFPPALRQDVDRPQGFEIPPENTGLADVLEAKQQFQFNMHNFNFTQEPILREVWVNIWWKDDSEVTDEIVPIAIFGSPLDVVIPPREHRELHYRCDVDAGTRIVSFAAHKHASTRRFRVWIERDGGGTEPVYESFDYNEMPTYQYDSATTNPAPDLAAKTDGASSGVLNLRAGDSVHFLCDITNDIPENIENNVTLRFANEVITGEMCILFGSSVGKNPLCPFGTRVQ